MRSLRYVGLSNALVNEIPPQSFADARFGIDVHLADRPRQVPGQERRFFGALRRPTRWPRWLGFQRCNGVSAWITGAYRSLNKN